MAHYGSVEIIRGVGQNSVSEGKTFGPVDVLDATVAPRLVSELTGATVGNERAWTDGAAPASLVGQWAAVDRNGKQATVRVWHLDPG